jgi:hypothetical protein
MMTEKWIDRVEIANYKQIAKTGFDDKINDLIIEAQWMDLRPLLGEALFNDINTNIATYTDLMDGGAYDYKGVTYINQGLKAVAVYYFYARYAYFGSVTDTPFSLVEKLNDKSKPVELSFKKSMYKNNQEMAFNIWRTVESYLIRTENEFFGNNCLPRKTTFRFSKIEKK